MTKILDRILFPLDFILCGSGAYQALRGHGPKRRRPTPVFRIETLVDHFKDMGIVAKFDYNLEHQKIRGVFCRKEDSSTIMVWEVSHHVPPKEMGREFIDVVNNTNWNKEAYHD